MSVATTTRLNYPPQIEAYVQDQLATGRFADESAFATAAFEVFRDLEQRHREIQGDVRRSIEEAERGDTAALDMSAIKAELVEELQSSLQAN